MLYERATRDGSIFWDWGDGASSSAPALPPAASARAPSAAADGGTSANRPEVRRRARTAALTGHAGAGGRAPSPRGSLVWLAMGVIVTRWVPSFRRRTPDRVLGIEWRYVTTEAVRASDPQFVVVRCPDVFFANATTAFGGHPKVAMGFQFSCFCKTVRWFQVALDLVPSARFIGKMEDDSVLHDARVLAELMHAYRAERQQQREGRETGASLRAERPRQARDGGGGARSPPLLWYGHFAWVLFHPDGRARFCGDADDHLLSGVPGTCARAARAGGTLSPFASGGIDIRSRALAARLSACHELWQFIDGFDPANASYAASCDGQQGFFFARCMHAHLRSATSAVRSGTATHHLSGATDADGGSAHIATLLHLPWPKFHPPSRRHGARLHTSLLHPHRPCLGSRSSRTIARGGPPGGSGCEALLPPTWRWNVGYSLLPFRFATFGRLRHGHSAGQLNLWLEPANRTVLKLYHQLHARREDDRYCDVLPCTAAADAPPLDGGNVTKCASMDACVGTRGACDGAADRAPCAGGVYYYRGRHTGVFAR